MKNLIWILRGICIFVVKAIKLNLGINGEHWDDGTYGGYHPEGLYEGMFLNIIFIVSFGFTVSIPSELVAYMAVMSCLYVFIMGFFVFPLLKELLEIHFPVGNWFTLPRWNKNHETSNNI